MKAFDVATYLGVDLILQCFVLTLSRLEDGGVALYNLLFHVGRSSIGIAANNPDRLKDRVAESLGIGCSKD
ncbi:hypothetical protein E4U53_006586 [Claviceps sorghi]|nr:hypothetical protein E4U53_006586 [Claviceps sorghi]